MLAALVAPTPIDVEIGPLRCTIPAYRADEWLLAISEQPTGVVPGLLPAADQEAVLAGLLDGTVTEADTNTAAYDAITEATGRAWWEAVRLVGMADQPGGSLYGHLLLSGVHPDRVTIAGWCSALHALVTRNMDDKDRNKFLFDLQLPPQGEDVDGENWDTVEW